MGTGDTVTRMYPVVVGGLVGLNIVEIAAGVCYSVALTGDGSVYTWGLNNVGQLGLGDTVTRMTPTKVDITDVVAIAVNSNGSHTVALKSDGTVWTWGRNNEGQLGIGSSDSNTHSTPVQVSISGVKAVATSSIHILALKSNGEVWGWGHNYYGELGDGTTTDRYTPVQTNITNVAKIATGGQHSLAIKTDGTLWSWGRNNTGQLGLGDTTNRTTPTQVSLSGVTEMIGGMYHTIALLTNGTVYTWGWNNEGQLGLGDTTDRYSPTQVPNVSTAVAVGAGGTNSSGYMGTSFIILADGSLLSFGSNTSSQLGI